MLSSSLEVITDTLDDNMELWMVLTETGQLFMSTSIADVNTFTHVMEATHGCMHPVYPGVWEVELEFIREGNVKLESGAELFSPKSFRSGKVTFTTEINDCLIFTSPPIDIKYQRKDLPS